VAFRITLPVPEIWSLAEMLVCVVARAPGMWQNIEKRSFDIINFTEIAWIFHNKVRYSTYIYIYVCIILYIYIYIHIIRSEWVRSLCCHLALCQSSGSPGRCCEDDSHLWDYARGLDGTWWDKMEEIVSATIIHWNAIGLVWKSWCPPILMVYRLSMFIIKVPIEVGRSHIISIHKRR